jgi:hypothetical protein
MANALVSERDIVFTVLTFVVAYSFREFLIELVEFFIPKIKEQRLLFLALVSMLLLGLTISLAKVWEVED